MPDLESLELCVDVRECPGPAVEGRRILAPTSLVAEDIVISLRLPAVPFLR
jgi:hypothetical protein